MTRIWIGRRESDILSYKTRKFDFSITYYGSNKSSNYSYIRNERLCTKYDSIFLYFVINCIKRIQKKYIDCELYFYNSRLGEKLLNIDPSIGKLFRNCNSFNLLDWLNNKSYVRLWLSNTVKVPPYTLFSKNDCNFNTLRKRFPDYDKYIIQYNYSSGGAGTYLLNKSNDRKIAQKLKKNSPYLVSPFIENAISACCHVIITEDDCLIFPIGIQILSDNMDYSGTTYILPYEIKIQLSKIANFISVIAKLLAQNGYRGICGYDFLLKDEAIYLIEINPRYMGSSYLINMVLFENNLPSLFELNDMAFKNDISILKYKDIVWNLEIPYTTFATHYDEHKNYSHYPECYRLFKDGHDFDDQCEENAYMYSYIIKKE